MSGHHNARTPCDLVHRFCKANRLSLGCRPNWDRMLTHPAPVDGEATSYETGKQNTPQLEWSRWVVVGEEDPRNIELREYEGPVVFQRFGVETDESGDCADGWITHNGDPVDRVVRWKPAPVSR